MINNTLLSISSLAIDIPIAVVLGIPVILACYSLVKRATFISSGQTRGYVYCGHKYFRILLWIDVFACIFAFIGMKLLSIPTMKDKLGTIVLLSVLYAISYWFVAFKPATREQLDEAKKNSIQYFEFEQMKNTGAPFFALLLAGLSMAFSMLLACFNPKHIIATIGDTVYYTNRTNDDIAISLGFAIVIIIVVLTIIVIISNLLCILIPAILYIATVATYFYNVYKYKNGPF